MALMACVIIGDILVFYCLFTIRELQTVSGTFLTDLAMTDLGVGLISLPLALGSIARKELLNDRWFCVMQRMSMALFIDASLLTLGLLSVLKYINVG